MNKYVSLLFAMKDGTTSTLLESPFEEAAVHLEKMLLGPDAPASACSGFVRYKNSVKVDCSYWYEFGSNCTKEHALICFGYAIGRMEYVLDFTKEDIENT